MNLLADEGVDRQIVEHLRQAGYTVSYVAEMEPGIPDDLVLQRASHLEAVLLTADKDFGELVYRQHQINSGVILLRLAGVPPLQKAEIVGLALQQYSSKLINVFTVITSKNIRIRKQSSR